MIVIFLADILVIWSMSSLPLVDREQYGHRLTKGNMVSVVIASGRQGAIWTPVHKG